MNTSTKFDTPDPTTARSPPPLLVSNSSSPKIPSQPIRRFPLLFHPPTLRRQVDSRPDLAHLFVLPRLDGGIVRGYGEGEDAEDEIGEVSFFFPVFEVFYRLAWGVEVWATKRSFTGRSGRMGEGDVFDVVDLRLARARFRRLWGWG